MPHYPPRSPRPRRRLLSGALALAMGLSSCAAPPTSGPRDDATGLLVLEEGGPSVTLLGTSEVRQRVTVAAGNERLAISPSGALGALSVPLDGRVQLLDVERMRRGLDIELGMDSRPSALAFIDDGRLLIGSSISGQISLYDEAYGKVIRVIQTGAASTAELAVKPEEQMAWLLDSGAGRVLRFSWTRDDTRRSVELGDGLICLAHRPDSQELWVLSKDSNRVVVLQRDTLEVLGEIPCEGGPRALAFDLRGGAWVVCEDSDEVVRYDAQTGTELARIRIPAARDGERARPVDILLEPEADRAWVACHGSGSLQIIDQRIERCVAEVDGLRQPTSLCFAP